MKKVGILTINDYNNYGNRLQNYATQEVLKLFGLTVKTIVNLHHSNKRITNKNNNANNPFIKEIKSKRLASFKAFTSLNIDETNFTITEECIPPTLSDQYDLFITGSDQVWNPSFKRFSSIDFLTFAPKNKRISYAASFGISQIPSTYVEKYRKWISDMEYLSVREKQGAKIIKELTGRDAIVLIDPTLMLTKEKWLSVASKAVNKPNTQYLLTYFLGTISDDVKKMIEITAKKNNLQVINLVDVNDPMTYIWGPSEFIDSIHSASVLFTDSYHGVIFSILLDTPVVLFERQGNLPSMNSRLETLLSTLNLESRLSVNIKTNKDIFEVDYSHINQILEEQKIKAYEYLKESLGLN